MTNTQNQKNKILFFPNWNGHLYLQETKDTSVKKIFEKCEFKNKKIIEIEKNNFEKTNKTIENAIKKELTTPQTNKIINICGDHSNTYTLYKTFAKNKKQKETKLIIFDAHPDVEISTKVVTHEDYLRNLIENKIILPQNIYLFGIRTFSRIELEYLIEKKIKYWTISEILKNKNKITQILEKITGQIYLSIDIDVLDPDFAPGTYYKEWCGLNIKELENFIKILKNKTQTYDICEYYKENDKDNITLKNVLKLIQLILK